MRHRLYLPPPSGTTYAAGSFATVGDTGLLVMAATWGAAGPVATGQVMSARATAARATAAAGTAGVHARTNTGANRAVRTAMVTSDRGGAGIAARRGTAVQVAQGQRGTAAAATRRGATAKTAFGVTSAAGTSVFHGAAAAATITSGVTASIAAAVTRTPRVAAQAGHVGRTGAAVARQAAMPVHTVVVTLSPFQARRAAALAVVQGAPMAAKAARRIAARIIASEGVAALLAAVIRSPGNGLRRLTVLLDGRRLSTGRSASGQVTAVDARNLTVARDIRRLPALKDD